MRDDDGQMLVPPEQHGDFDVVPRKKMGLFRLRRKTHLDKVLAPRKGRKLPIELITAAWRLNDDYVKGLGASRTSTLDEPVQPRFESRTVPDSQLNAITTYRRAVEAMVRISPHKTAVMVHIIADQMSTKAAGEKYGLKPQQAWKGFIEILTELARYYAGQSRKRR